MFAGSELLGASHLTKEWHQKNGQLIREFVFHDGVAIL